ncbi:SDR family NAD(P)-dependent oxidoreductase [Lactobacillus terrae]|uniref:SDR family NAD(P)-dependent oxidoreductase n=1 Tax=Lactobacillus terrae TaxID=2269374 RepID=UPI000C1B754F|nr:SDR family oxidoreductase [Lactobacillus terrae]
MKNLSGQNVLITGASSGIGRQIAINAAIAGANLILVARNEDRLIEVKNECSRLGHENSFNQHYIVDVSDYSSIDKLVDDLESNNETIDILVNAAGFGDFSLLVDNDMAIIESMFKVNVFGLMYLTRSIASSMINNHKGHIINLGSMAGKIPTPKSAAYSATKAAVIAFSDSLRMELKPLGVKVTTVNPGPVDTNFFEIADHDGSYQKSVQLLMLKPDKLAKDIVKSFNGNKREINRPRFMNVVSILYKTSPKLGDILTSSLGNKK